MTTIAQYLEAGESHFVALGLLPIGTPSTSVNDALRLMREHETMGILIRLGRRDYRLIGLDQFGPPETLGDHTQTTLAQFADVAMPLELIDVSQTRDDAVQLYRRAGAVAVVARNSILGDGVIGLLTEAEDSASRFSAPPGIYVCERGHNFPPPPPNPPKCVLDGTDLTRP